MSGRADSPSLWKPNAVAGTGADDAFFDGAHWNGVEWSFHDTPPGDDVGFISTRPGEAYVVGVVPERAPFLTDALQTLTFVQHMSRATHDGFAPAARKELLRELGGTSQPLFFPVPMSDGSFLFVIDLRTVVAVRPGDLP